MRIEIEIPKEFEEHFKQDKFKDSLERIMADIKSSLKSRECSYAGRYEYETVEMLEKAFENSRQAYPVDKVVEELEILMKDLNVIEIISHIDFDNTIQSSLNNFLKSFSNKAIEIVKQGGVSDYVCEWKIDGDMAINPHNLSKYKIKQYDGLYALDTCQYCRKKIKVVE